MIGASEGLHSGVLRGFAALGSLVHERAHDGAATPAAGQQGFDQAWRAPEAVELVTLEDCLQPQPAGLVGGSGRRNDLQLGVLVVPNQALDEALCRPHAAVLVPKIQISNEVVLRQELVELINHKHAHATKKSFDDYGVLIVEGFQQITGSCGDEHRVEDGVPRRMLRQRHQRDRSDAMVLRLHDHLHSKLSRGAHDEDPGIRPRFPRPLERREQERQRFPRACLRVQDGVLTKAEAAERECLDRAGERDALLPQHLPRMLWKLRQEVLDGGLSRT
mmetsp:Transcript_95533/g.270235  ORF Transcript_95533/g.270235 Transcript_95533/m.270235 type:complete len:276 (-) Transcript_95533:341-1168(-)